jgi:hypothetical protein
MKGLATKAAVQTVLVTLVGGVIALAVAGPVLGNIEEGFGILGEMTADSSGINVSDKATFSQASLYVYQRASNDGCFDPDSNSGSYKSPTVPEQIDGDLTPPEGINREGYPALQDTFLTSEPSCIATDDPEGNDMEGTYSRVNFVIDETRNGPIVLGQGNTWIDDRIRGARDVGFYEATQEECSQNVMETAINTGAAGVVIGGQSSGLLGASVLGGAGFVAGAGASLVKDARFVGVGRDYIVFFRDDVDNDRTDAWLTDSDKITDDRIYCYAFTEQVSNADFQDAELLESPLDSATEDFSNTNVRLCPGDRGYIQMNKQKPHNDGEAGEDWGGNAHNFPFIQVTHSGGSC